MLLATTPIIEGKRITTYYGIVSGETIIGANVFRDFFASIRDIVGGRSGSYEEVLREAKDTALKEMSEQARQMGANAVIGVDLDYETVGGSGSMLMVTASGTAVFLEYVYLLLMTFDDFHFINIGCPPVRIIQTYRVIAFAKFNLDSCCSCLIPCTGIKVRLFIFCSVYSYLDIAFIT